MFCRKLRNCDPHERGRGVEQNFRVEDICSVGFGFGM